MPHILTLATLFPNALQPNFGIFVERQTAELAKREYFTVTVINPIGIPPWPIRTLARYKTLKALPEHENWGRLNVYRPRFRLIPRLAQRNPAAIAKALLPLVQRLHASNPFDTIDAEFFYPDGPAAMHIAHKLDIPFSIKARGADIHYWGQKKSCRSQMLDAAQSATGLLAVSQALKADMAEMGMNAGKIRVHYTGLNQDRFKPVDRAEAKAKLGITGPLLVTVGALISRKNQHLVIEALADLKDATLILAGTGAELGNYMALAEELGVRDRVRFAGSVPHNELPQLLGAADIMVLVSKSEGLANAWVEALACGTPIIISAAGGARELLTDPVAGRIVNETPPEIARAVQDILANPPAQQKVRDQVKHFSWKKNGDDLAAHFYAILAKA